MDKYPQAELRDWYETDVIGSMLINGSIKTKYTLYTEDLHNPTLRKLYRHLINNSDEHGSFTNDDVLTDNISANRYILTLMNNALISNIDTKCRYLVQR